ncbi:hypothetical protein Zmor_006825 [Zophobas morio]|uniref:Uncharacterized protein n=1 Tax=Zophobas morio TaxID=2755281 RepID=A0AA38IVL3_9CUCU|nr:hypothetical protein Zmor_006825 [Zophobas morio]
MKELSRLFRAYCHDSHTNWYSILPNIELLFNVTPHLSTGFSPYEIISGKNPPNALTNLIEPLLPAVAAKPLQQIHSEALSNLRRAANQRKNSKRNLRRIPSVRLCPDKPHPNVYTLKDPVSNFIRGNHNITNLKLYSYRH